MTKLLVSGDSWTSCWPLEEELGHRDFGWPNLVSSKLNYDLIDKSRAGSSNYRIYRKAFDGLLYNRPDVAIVFLTSWTRMETGSAYGENPGRIYQHLMNNTSYQSEYVFKNFFNGYKNYSDMLRMIISLQKLSASLNIPCYFLDTFNNNLLFELTEDDFKQILSYNNTIFDNMDDERIVDKFNKVKMLTSQIDTEFFISQIPYQTIVKNCSLDQGHPTKDGHTMIADVVLQFLKEKYHGRKTI